MHAENNENSFKNTACKHVPILLLHAKDKRGKGIHMQVGNQNVVHASVFTSGGNLHPQLGRGKPSGPSGQGASSPGMPCGQSKISWLVLQP